MIVIPSDKTKYPEALGRTGGGGEAFHPGALGGSPSGLLLCV